MNNDIDGNTTLTEILLMLAPEMCAVGHADVKVRLGPDSDGHVMTLMMTMAVVDEETNVQIERES